jgi:branched-chain amino acid transport system substrate-binding protein
MVMKIGFFGALTGPNAQLGINIDNGEKLAVQQYNATNPQMKVSVDPFDSQGLPAQAPQGVQKMITDNVVAVIGPAFSSESQAADPILEKAQIPNVSASATNVKLAQNGWKYFHRVLADDSAQGPGDADYMVKTLGDKSVAVVDDSSTYGLGLADYVRSTLKTNGGSDALDDHIDPNGQDYSSTVNKITAAKPAAVFFGGYYDAAGRLAKQLKDAGYTGAFVSGDGSKDPGFIKSAGSPATADGAYLSCPCEDVTASAAAQAFNAAYMKAYGTPPQTYSGEAYDATNFVLAAIKSGAMTKAAINSYLGSNQSVGVTKTIKFLPNGNISGGTVFMYQVKNGNIVQVGTTS